MVSKAGVAFDQTRQVNVSNADLTKPNGFIDTFYTNGLTESGTVDILGWADDGHGKPNLQTLQLLLDGSDMGPLTYPISRQDGQQGFNLIWDSTKTTNGTHTVTLHLVSKAGVVYDLNRSIIVNNVVNLVSITLSPSTVSAGDNSTATVTLSNPAQAGGFRVDFPIDGPYADILEDHVIIPQGATSATVQVLTDYHITSQYVSQIKATAGNTTVQATLTVNPAPVQVTSLQITPSSIVGGNTAKLTIYLNHPSLTGGTTIIWLDAINRSVANVNTLAVVPAGATQTTVTVYTYPVTTSTSASIQAFAVATGGEPTVSTTFTVQPR